MPMPQEATVANRRSAAMVDEPSADEYPRPRWVDAFPWIEAASSDLFAAHGGAQAWWLQPVDTFGTAIRAERLADLSDVMLERLTRWTIGQIFPTLPAG